MHTLDFYVLHWGAKWQCLVTETDYMRLFYMINLAFVQLDWIELQLNAIALDDNSY